MYVMKKSTPALMIMLAMMVANAQVIAEPRTAQQPANTGSSNFPPAYPEWPERFKREEMIPPPPAGPYMSSAMSGVDAFPDYSGGLRNEHREGQIRSPLFEPDMPWPVKHDMPERWMPDSGKYNFVPDDIVKRLEESPASPSYWQGYGQGYGRPQMPPQQPYYGGYRRY